MRLARILLLVALAMTLLSTGCNKNLPPTRSTDGRATIDARVMPSTPASPTSIAELERYMKIRVPSSPEIAPDGRLYVRDWPDGVYQLYRRDDPFAMNARYERLTDFEDGLSGFAVSPTGDSLVLSAAIGGSEQNDLFLLDAETDEITTLYSDPSVVYSFQEWLRDGSGFFFTANDDSPSDFHIYLHDLRTGRSEKVLDREGYWFVTDVSNDASRLLVGRYFSVAESEAYELSRSTGELNEISLGDGPAYNAAVGYLPDERSVLMISDYEGEMNQLYARDLRTGRVTSPMPSLRGKIIDSAAIDHDRTRAAIEYNDEGYGSLTVADLPGFEVVDLPMRERGVVGAVGFSGDMLVYTLANARNPGEAFAIDLENPRQPRRITRAETQGVNLSRIPLPEVVRYESFDGRMIPAFVYLPPSYKAGDRIPFVIRYHGGPESQSRPGFSAWTAFLLSRGYGFMEPNVRGSTGYGREFHQLDNYRGRMGSVKDGVEAARFLIEQGYANPGEIAAYGGSYGGFMSVACAIEGGDEIYGAAVNVVGIVNFETFLEQTKSYRRALREAEYGPLSDPDFLASISPIHRVDEIEVPMLIAHGLNDPRVPVGEAMQLAVELQKRGYDPELVFFPDEGHGFAKLQNRLLFYDRTIRFLDRHIGN